MSNMSDKENDTSGYQPKGTRWKELEVQILGAAQEDDRSFSGEAKYLVRLGLQARARARDMQGGDAA